MAINRSDLALSPGLRAAGARLDFTVRPLDPLARGACLGPAVLFWSLLAVNLVAWIALGRAPLTPLRARQWFLLSLGLTQAPLPISILIVAWLFALGWRRQRGATTPRRAFNLLQVVLAAATLAALAGLCWSITNGLLALPEMQISGKVHLGSAVVPRPLGRRSPPAEGLLRAALSLPPGDAGLGPVAGAGAPALAEVGLGMLQRRRPVAAATEEGSVTPAPDRSGGRGALVPYFINMITYKSGVPVADVISSSRFDTGRRYAKKESICHFSEPRREEKSGNARPKVYVIVSRRHPSQDRPLRGRGIPQ